VTPPLNPNLYPASYRTSVWKGGLKILGAMTVFWLTVLARTDIIDRAVAPSVLIFVILCALFLLITLLNVTFARVTLYPDRIERLTLFGTKTMLRADVVKLERRRRLFFQSYILVSRKGLFEGVLLPSGIEADAAWNAWMPVAQDAYVPTRSAVLSGGRIALAVMTLLLSLGCLITALVIHIDVKRRATETPVTATVAKARSRIDRGEAIYFAQLIFDRKQSNGDTIHCDVPDVPFGTQPTTVGAIIRVAPRATTCWEPDIICETCTRPSDALALDILIAGSISGMISLLLVWITLRRKNKPA
jgi:hypothetical protein